MARIILGSYMVRYPLGGMLSWVLQFLVGFRRLGHEIYFVEKYGYPNSCYNPTNETVSDDCTYGTTVLSRLLKGTGLEDRWCFVERSGKYHGLSRARIERAFSEADVFIDMGTHGSWQQEAENTAMKVLIDGEPGFTQIKMANNNGSVKLPQYDYYFTTGKNIDTEFSSSPTAGINWRYLYHPVQLDLFPVVPCPKGASYSTVMNWKSHEPIEYNGKVFGQKDVEFQKFIGLPRLVSQRMQVAISGKKLPLTSLREHGWDVVDARLKTISFESFRDYIQQSRGEFSVCKNVFVETRTGWFSDRSAAYLASGRPVVMQDTGFSRHLPCGHGLFAVNDAEEAKSAIDAVESDYESHTNAARAIANEYLSTQVVLKKFMEELGL